MITLQFKISDEAYNFLLEIKELKNVEFSDIEFLILDDIEFLTLDDFKRSFDYLRNIKSIEQYLSSNCNGRYHLIKELENCGLVEINENSWKPTYKLTFLAKMILE